MLHLIQSLSPGDVAIIIKTSTCNIGFDDINLATLFYRVLRGLAPAADFVNAVKAIGAQSSADVMSVIKACVGPSA